MTSFQETPETKIMLTELSKILDRKQSDVIRKAIEFYFEHLTKNLKLTKNENTGQPANELFSKLIESNSKHYYS